MTPFDSDLDRSTSAAGAHDSRNDDPMSAVDDRFAGERLRQLVRSVVAAVAEYERSADHSKAGRDD